VLDVRIYHICCELESLGYVQVGFSRTDFESVVRFCSLPALSHRVLTLLVLGGSVGWLVVESQ